MKTINFRINYEVKFKQKFERFIALYAIEIQQELRQLIIEPYHKFEHQFQATFNIEIEETDEEKIIYQILRLANHLYNSGSHKWTFKGPQIVNDELQFECILNNEVDNQPIKWAQIELLNV